MTPTVFIVDDDSAMREALRQTLEFAGFNVETYANGSSFLATCKKDCVGCLLLDVAMPDMSGQEVQAALTERGVRIPIIFLTGHGDIPMAVRAVQAGALDFLEKPVRSAHLLERVRHALALDEERRRTEGDAQRIQQCYGRLSQREREVMALVISGQSSKEIARQLDLSPRTVEAHRTHVMSKMGAANVAELVSMAAYCSD
jgi:two-component system response regulator FixJ